MGVMKSEYIRINGKGNGIMKRMLYVNKNTTL